ncbi:sugar ABC transporter ATP-binding protein [Rhizobium laguerreae]|uniref:sugar ABC transporter ATP-binding protein n=1 Tax=Rhizobium laguerreae TaxID=1076926 RepID=UPI001C914BB2|nr:sugar ABC transporter ATP-binding protein [Rhizobium laguerreae]MBY3307674.1 sugar ABC transporter ATP-binding protein [Rhizobium laguerreae]
MTTVIELRKISKEYRGVFALSGIDLSLQAGEIHAIAGENGAGKSTLINILSGSVAPSSGELWLYDGRVESFGPREALSKGISVVHQELTACPSVSVTENVLLGQLPSRFGVVNWREARKQATEALARLKIHLDVDALVSELSLGQRQLLEIARAVFRNAKILVLDEPSAMLGKHDIEIVHQTVMRLKAKGVTVVYITHHLDEVFKLADRVTVLRDGRCVGTWPTKEMSEQQLIKHMTGRDVVQTIREASLAGSTTLKVSALSGRMFENVSFELQAGEVFGIAGVVGSGRSELVRAVSGFEKTSSGDVLFRNKLMRSGDHNQARRLGMAFLSEDRKTDGLLLDRSIRENVSLAGMFGRSPLSWITRRKEKDLAIEALKPLKTRYQDVDQPVRELSGGNQQKVLLARWLITKPKLLILDEPTRGVDVGARSDIYKIIHQLASEGVTVLVVSSEINELILICDRVMVMRKGRSRAILDRPQISEDTISRYALSEDVEDKAHANSI